MVLVVKVERSPKDRHAPKAHGKQILHAIFSLDVSKYRAELHFAEL